MAYTLNATHRTRIGKVVDVLRRQRQIPAVVYGHGSASQPITLETGVFEAVLRQAGNSSLVDLAVDGAAPTKVLIQSVQRHPTTGRILHADLYQVKMTEKLEADIELIFAGESPAVKELGGIFVHPLDRVKVSCLPGDLVPSITVDISKLATFEDRIHVSDIVVPQGITIMEKPDDVVASVTPPRSEEELASLSAKVEENVEAVEVAEKKKADDEAEATTTESDNK